MDDSGTRATAVAIAGGRITAVGGDHDLESLVGTGTRVIEAAGRTVLPGLIDAHTHLGFVARNAAGTVDCRTPPVRRVGDILDRAAERARSTAPGTWIVLQGSNFQSELVEDRRFPTPGELTAVSAEHPILYLSSVHALIVNQKALELAGIDGSTEDPPGSHIERDADGNPTGRLADMLDRFPIPSPSEAELAGAVRAVVRDHYLANGVTSVHEIWDSALVMRLLAEAIASREAPLRVSGYGWVPLAGSVTEVASGRIGDVRLEEDWFEFGGVKLFADGGSSSHTAAFYEDYADSPGQCGSLVYEPDELAELVRQAHDAGSQLMIHAVGDRATDVVIDAYERTPRAGLRPRIEHGANVAWNAERAARCKAAGVLPVPNPGFVWNYAVFWPKALGAERARGCIPLRTLLDDGFEVPGNSDTTGGAPQLLNPFHTMWAALNRRTFRGEQIDAEERITRHEALTMYTRYAARAGRQEASRGTLEVGKLGDVIVLDRPLDQVSDEEFNSITVAHTLVGGVELDR